MNKNYLRIIQIKLRKELKVQVDIINSNINNLLMRKALLILKL